jgi:hypothetical protein
MKRKYYKFIICLEKLKKRLQVHVLEAFFKCGDRVGIRTPNLLIRSQVLYPIELRNRLYFGVQN